MGFDSNRLSSLTVAQPEAIRAVLNGQPLTAVDEVFAITRSPVHGAVQTIHLAMERLRISAFFAIRSRLMSVSTTVQTSTRSENATDRAPEACLVRRALLTASCLVFFLPPVVTFAAIDDNQFQEARNAAGAPLIDSPGETWGAAWGDLNNDGCPDLWLGMHQYLPTALYRNNCNGRFTNVINSAVTDAAAHYMDDTHGVAWADMDNDGDQDLIEVCGGGAGASAGSSPIRNNWRNNLFINDSGQLSEQAQSYGLDNPRARSRTPLWVDIDRDGHLDLVIAALQTAPDQYPSTVFRQVGGGGFVDAGLETGFDAGSCHSVMVSHLGPAGEPVLLCGDTSRITRAFDMLSTPFVDLQSVIGTALFNAQLFDVAIGDFNGDLTPDIFGGVTAPNLAAVMRVGPTNDRLQAYLSSNSAEQGFTFTAPAEVQIEFGWDTDLSDIHLGANGVSPSADADSGLNGPNRYPHHVRLTLSTANVAYAGLPASRPAGIYIGYVGGAWQVRVVRAGAEVNLVAHASGISAPTAIGAVRLDQGEAAAPVLFLNEAGALVKRDTADAFLNPASTIRTYARSLVTGDFDNDMDLDVYIGSSGRVANVPNQLFENLGNGTFRLVHNGGGAAGDTVGRTDTVTLVDYDQDGFLDLFVTQGRYPAPVADAGQQQLFRNQGNSNGWILIDLEGVASNRDGVGAVIYATTPDGKMQMREQHNGVHRYVQNYVQTHFGLAINTTVDLDIFWPSGTADHFSGLQANQIVRLVEGTGTAGGPRPTCGQPEYDKAAESEVFLWNDCDTNRWHVRVTAGGNVSKMKYTGSLTGSRSFTDKTGFSIEANDVLSLPRFALNVNRDGQDGFDFNIPAGTLGCLTLTSPVGTRVLAGLNRVSVGNAVSLPNFGSCTLP